jgi:sulfotransferase family protein
MIVWIASYPRSGNSLAAQMLADVFLLPSTSAYRARVLPGEDTPSGAPSSGQKTQIHYYEFNGPWPEFCDAARAAPQSIYIKTHDAPSDDGQAIYVVRDPRAALVSYAQFLREENPQLGATVEDTVGGRVGFGSWSAHLDAWQPDRRPKTLLLRYEDMMERPHVAIATLARFLGVPPLRPWRNNFAVLRRLRPDLYRVGSNERNIGELTSAQLALIHEMHEPWMRRLGYLTE